MPKNINIKYRNARGGNRAIYSKPQTTKSADKIAVDLGMGILREERLCVLFFILTVPILTFKECHLY